LPSLPELKNDQKFQPRVIKQEVTKPQQEMLKSQFEEPAKPIKISPESKITPLAKSREIAEISPKSRPPIKGVKPIYVRLDKFEASLDSFGEIKKKIIDMEEVLRKTREIKQKEEQELETWEREIQIIKSRIDSIDKTIFDKLD